MTRRLLAVAFLAWLAAPPPRCARAQDSRWEREVRNQLQRAGGFLRERGYELTHDVFTGTLGKGESESVTLTLGTGRSYALIAVCDEDCNDIDLRLFDADGDEVDSDVELDDNPIVQVTPRETTKFRLKVLMTGCSTSPCYYGVGVFGK